MKTPLLRLLIRGSLVRAQEGEQLRLKAIRNDGFFYFANFGREGCAER
ncbi:hypothetical protein LV92_02634 [Arenibacter echinorum]|uniref:Uncharacterized protein n=1 Tax=Arenibacter echinorum TaxID=440515 RepID=A0A327R6V1_9FLAO|nr:hypothetical protein LV92_02634 [Arenibacter echinorum]